MSAKVRFVAIATVVSLMLFAALWWLPDDMGLYDPQVAGFLIPTLAIMLAAQGVPLRRRARYAVITAAASVGVGVIGSVAGLDHLSVSGFSFMTRPLQSALGLAYSCLVIGMPVVVLIVFVGRRPSVLWTPRR